MSPLETFLIMFNFLVIRCKLFVGWPLFSWVYFVVKWSLNLVRNLHHGIMYCILFRIVQYQNTRVVFGTLPFDTVCG